MRVMMYVARVAALIIVTIQPSSSIIQLRNVVGVISRISSRIQIVFGCVSENSFRLFDEDFEISRWKDCLAVLSANLLVTFLSNAGAIRIKYSLWDEMQMTFELCVQRKTFV